MDTTEVTAQLAQAMGGLTALLNEVPDSMEYTAVRNRLVMAQTALDHAQDYVSAAVVRYADAKDK